MSSENLPVGMRKRLSTCANKALSALLALVLCAGLLPAVSLPDTAWAGGVATEEYNHGTMAISCDAADDDGVIYLEVGQSAEIVVDPYQHVQYEGCDLCNEDGYCPEGCGMGDDCWVQGLGCKCDTDPLLRTADIVASAADEGVAELSAVSASATLTASASTLGSMNTGSIAVTALSVGTTEITVTADLFLWFGASATYTLVVTEADDSGDAGDSGDTNDSDDSGESVAVEIGMSYTDDYETISTSMGRYPAGKADFALYPADDALEAYRQAMGDDTLTTAQMISAWVEGISAVTIDGVALSNSAFDEWKSELTNPTDDADVLLYFDVEASSRYATLVLPVALFDTDHADNQYDTKTVVIESEGFAAVSTELTYRNLGSDGLVVRVLDEDSGEVLFVTTLDDDTLKSLTVQSGYTTTTNCGMAGLRSYTAEGVLLTDVLAAAGVTFSEGMTLELRMNDYIDEAGDEDTTETGYGSNSSFAYEDLMAARYYYANMWDDETVYAELADEDNPEGRTVYATLVAEGSDWSSGDYADALFEILGQGAVRVSPLLAWTWVEGVVGWGGSDTTTQDYNGYSEHLTYRFLFGMSLDEDGNATDEATTFSNCYAVFGIDIVADADAVTVDKSALAEEIATAETLDEDVYTAASWKVYAAALASAQEVYDDANASQVEADEATESLAAAREALLVSYEYGLLVSRSVAGYREAEYGTPPNGTAADGDVPAGMHVLITLTFDGEVAVTDADALLESLDVQFNGTSILESSNVSGYEVTADGTSLLIDFTLYYAAYAGRVTLAAVDTDTNLLSGVTADGKDIEFAGFTTLVDTGLAFEAIEVVEGDAASGTAASTTFVVTSSALIRSMNHVVWLTSAGSDDGTGSSIIANSGDYSQSTVAHHHKFWSFTLADSAAYIVDGGASTLAAYGYTLTDNGDGTFTITADTAVDGEILWATTYTDSFFNATGLAYGQDVEGVEMPEATDGGALADQDALDELAELIEQAAAICKAWNAGSDDYTDSSVAVLQTALSAAQELMAGDEDTWTAVAVAKATAALSAALASLVSSSSGSDAEEVEGNQIVRIGGANRYETAALEACEAYDTADTVILATGADFADALAATALAGALDAPILLTKSAALSSEATAAIFELGADEVIIVGGTSAVSADVADALEQMELSVTRLAGATRYETAEQIYIYGLSAGSGGGSVWGDAVIVASGASFPDALSVSSLAYSQAYPIFLAKKDGSLTTTTRSIITVSGADAAIVVGGTSVVSSTSESALASIFGSGGVTRLGGANRYATSLLIADYAVSGGYLSWDGAAVASGSSFPDALAGAAVAGTAGSVMLLVSDAKASLVAQAVGEQAESISKLYILGGTSAVSEDARAALVEALGWDDDDYTYTLVDE